MQNEVLTYIKKHELFPKSETVIVAVSGGVDSMCLLHFLHTYQSKLGIRLVVASVNHMFRGEESEKDVTFVREYCENLNIPVHTANIDVPSYIESSGKSSQLAARELRYQFLNEVRFKEQAEIIVTAHHADDQVETFLFRWLRSGTHFTCIEPVQEFMGGKLVRPFLCVTKEDIITYQQNFTILFREDPSNHLTKYTRNRFRNFISSVLSKENPRLPKRTQLLTEQFRRDEQFFASLTRATLEEIQCKDAGNQPCISLEKWERLDEALKYRVLREWFSQEKSLASYITIEKLDAIVTMLKDNSPQSQLDILDGVSVYKRYNRVYFGAVKYATEDYILYIQEEGKFYLPNGSYFLVQRGKSSSFLKGNYFVQSSTHTLNFYVRPKRDGDKIYLPGLDGHKKLKKIFREHHVTLEQRNEWPVVCNANDEIIWVPHFANDAQQEEQTNINWTITYVFGEK